jgi:hypothetical protein
MKKLLLLLSIIIVLGLDTSAQSNKKPAFKFATEKYDFGNIPKNKPVTTIFKFTNIGSEPLIISDVFINCNCAKIIYTKTPVAKHAKGFITVTYNSPNANLFRQHIIVISNAKAGDKSLTITGKTY